MVTSRVHNKNERKFFQATDTARTKDKATLSRKQRFLPQQKQWRFVALILFVAIVMTSLFTVRTGESKSPNMESAKDMSPGFISTEENHKKKTQDQDQDSSGSNMALKNAISTLKDRQINFLAFDFDKTIVDVHTGGRWKETPEKLASHVRPTMRDLIHDAQTQGIQVAVVTFSEQIRLIESVLRLHQLCDEPGEVEKVKKGGGEDCWSIPVVGGMLDLGNKKTHISHAQKEIIKRQQAENSVSRTPKEKSTAILHNKITPSSTLLIDDDERNIMAAVKDGHSRAILFRPEDESGAQLLGDIAKLL